MQIIHFYYSGASSRCNTPIPGDKKDSPAAKKAKLDLPSPLPISYGSVLSTYFC